MTVIDTGHVTGFFLYDVAEAIDLTRVPDLVGSASPARLVTRPITPAYVQYQPPPLLAEASALGIGDVAGFRVRFKIFDYGVISVALTSPLPGAWMELVDRASEWQDSARLSADAESACRALMKRIAAAMRSPRDTLETEDYLVFVVNRLEGQPSAERLLEEHGDDIASLLRGERQPLSRQERDEVLRHRLSYLESDLVIPTWNAAFVYDTDPGSQSTLEILEFANSQLLEFRYYDALIDAQLAQLYPQLQAPSSFSWLVSRRHTRAARQVHSLFIDVTELTDRAENTLKFVGDVYAARLFALAAARLGLNHWKANVRKKLETLDDIYRFSVEHSSMARGEFLELSIVLILVLELVLFFAGIMR
jgi:hypothetical protein